MPPMSSTTRTRTSSRPTRSFILRVLEERVETVSVVYELHDIADGTKRRFASLAALKRHLARGDTPA